MNARRTPLLLILFCLVWMPPSGATAEKDVLHTVRTGESLSLIALRVYGNAATWPVIHAANRDRLDDPDLIHIGDRLVIPDLGEDQLANERSNHGTLRLVTGNAYPPFADEDLFQGGMAIDMIARTAERAGYQLSIEATSWASGYTAARDGDYDGTLPYILNAERREEFAGLASRPLTEVLVRVFTRADDHFAFHSDGDLSGLTACRPHGYYTHDVDPLVESGIIDLERADSIRDCFQSLAIGDVDFVPVNRFTAAEAIRSAGLEYADFSMADRPLHVDTLHLFISPHADRPRKILRHIDEALLDMESRGDLHNLRVGHIARLREAGLAGPWGIDSGTAEAEPSAVDAGDTAVEDAVDSEADAIAAVDDSARHDDAVSKDTEAAHVQLVSGPDYAPFAGSDLPSRGMTSEIVERAFELQGKSVRIRFHAWPDAREAVANGDFDATYPWIKTDGRRRDFHFSDPLYAAPVMIFTAADSTLEYGAYNDLRNTSACKAEGYYRSDIEHLVAAGFVSLTEAPDLHTCFARVAAGDADFLTINRFTGWRELQRSDDLDPADFRMLERPLAEIDLRVMMARDADNVDDLMETVNAGLGELASSGELQAIQERHLETHLTESE